MRPESWPISRNKLNTGPQTTYYTPRDRPLERANLRVPLINIQTLFRSRLQLLAPSTIEMLLILRNIRSLHLSRGLRRRRTLIMTSIRRKRRIVDLLRLRKTMIWMRMHQRMMKRSRMMMVVMDLEVRIIMKRRSSRSEKRLIPWENSLLRRLLEWSRLNRPWRRLWLWRRLWEQRLRLRWKMQERLKIKSKRLLTRMRAMIWSMKMISLAKRMKKMKTMLLLKTLQKKLQTKIRIRKLSKRLKRSNTIHNIIKSKIELSF